ncbi:MAG: LolA-related protein [Rhodovibrio sp.]|nr:LolA-related protein [Rhodovibrio sp.]
MSERIDEGGPPPGGRWPRARAQAHASPRAQAHAQPARPGWSARRCCWPRAGLACRRRPAPRTAARTRQGGNQASNRAPELDRLAGCLAKDGRVEVAFREERLVTSVDEMLESRGRLIYEPPARLEKIVEQPRRERAVVEGDRMSVFDADGDEVATFDLAERPGLKASFDAVRALLKGDAEALRAGFEVALSADPDGPAPGAWEMRLSPKGEDAGYTLSRILIDGQGAPGLSGGANGGDGGGANGGAAPCQVKTIDVRQRDGGRRVLHLRPRS